MPVKSSNEMIHGRYNLSRELHRRLSVEAAKREIGIQELMAYILDSALPHLDG